VERAERSTEARSGAGSGAEPFKSKLVARKMRVDHRTATLDEGRESCWPRGDEWQCTRIDVALNRA
jgi:hypothetical protein